MKDGIYVMMPYDVVVAQMKNNLMEGEQNIRIIDEDVVFSERIRLFCIHGVTIFADIKCSYPVTNSTSVIDIKFKTITGGEDINTARGYCFKTERETRDFRIKVDDLHNIFTKSVNNLIHDAKIEMSKFQGDTV